MDWSLIQPQFLGAGCDVVILLDCCYAGQAVRTRVSNTVEFLAATDKDQMTPMGDNKWPSFTNGLIVAMEEMMDKNEFMFVPAIYRRLLDVRAGLRRQPFYVSMAPGGSMSHILLSRWQGMIPQSSLSSNQMDPVSPTAAAFLDLRLRLFHPLDANNRRTLQQWMTRDSPPGVADIEVVDKVLSEASAVNHLGQTLLGDARQDGNGAPLLALLSSAGQNEAVRLMQELSESITMPGQAPLGDLEAIQLINVVKQKSNISAMFLEDCVSSLDVKSLPKLDMKNVAGAEDLAHRISMRLTLLATGHESLPDPVRVEFDDQVKHDTRLRMGRRNGSPVLVEYIYYEPVEEAPSHVLSLQIARVSALHAEPKDPAFRTLSGLGYLHDSLHGPRFGFIYSLPQERVGWQPTQLSQMIVKVKVVPLELRLRLAYILCEALLQLHSIGWFHKGIKSDNIIIFAKPAATGIKESRLTEPLYASYDLSSPYIIGFDCSRPEGAETRGTVDFDTNVNIYRHPDRWGRSIRFERRHDIYALVSNIPVTDDTVIHIAYCVVKGILLLELGCWKTLPSMDGKQKGFSYVKDPEELRKFFLTSAHAKLTHAAGIKYADAMKSCFEHGKWMAPEGWEVRNSMREQVANSIRSCYGRLAAVSELNG